MTFTKGNITALILGLFAFVPQLTELFAKGQEAFAGCKALAQPFFASVVAFIAALSAKGIF